MAYRRITRALVTTMGLFTAFVTFGAGSALVAAAASPSVAYSISSGFGQTCAVTGPNSAAKCWGRNDYGELGTGNTTSSLTPVGVSGLSSKVAAVSAGGSRSCALSTSGGLKCWGTSPGNGVSSSLIPVSVNGLASGVRSVSAGGTFTCAVTTAGEVRCWGSGTLGQLGDGLLTSSSVPVTPTGLSSGIAAVSVGAQHACALTTAGGVRCWGWNNYGETGDPSGATSTPTPIDVAGLPSDVTAVFVGGYHSCAVTSTGGAWCWGENQVGQLGDGTTTDRATPAPVSGISGVTSMTGGTYHTCALTTGGAARCWGSNNSGQLGDGSMVDRWLPVPVVGLSSGVVQISGGRFHTCSVDGAGRAKCWGHNLWGQLGDGTTTWRRTPVGVSGLSR
ncbi:MAG: chromosome condensation regulator RCC1 [Actinomycetota bacterium]